MVPSDAEDLHQLPLIGTTNDKLSSYTSSLLLGRVTMKLSSYVSSHRPGQVMTKFDSYASSHQRDGDNAFQRPCWFLPKKKPRQDNTNMKVIILGGNQIQY